jgi:hypothetical protein
VEGEAVKGLQEFSLKVDARSDSPVTITDIASTSKEIFMRKILMPVLLLLFPVFSYAIDCTNEYQKHVKTDLNLTY